MSIKKTVIVGAGAIGSLIGSLLAESGSDITLCDNNKEKIAAIRERGICIRNSFDADTTRRYIRINAVSDISEAGQAVASKYVTWIILGGIIFVQTFPLLLWFGIGLFALTTLFSFVTLPVEINASKRALVWLSDAGITNSATYPSAVDALKSAAYTYVVAALASLATLVYYILLALRRN